jgi:dTDP-4-amino-4,6-dideoxygalactose transaminase
MLAGRLFRYGEMGADQNDAALLETEFAALIGRRYCVAVNSGGSAIFLALKLAGVKPGDPVLVNGFTLAPVPGAIIHAGARPVIVEIGEDYVIDVDDLAVKAKASGARVLLLSHMRGHIADMDAVMALCDAQGLALVEDCAHAMCATWDGRTIGTFGGAAAFSAQTYKHLNAGEGGFLLTDDEEKAARAILHSGSYMLHGQHLSRPSDAALDALSGEAANFSLRMTALAAAMLRPQLAELPRRVARWRAIHARIAAGLAGSQHAHVPPCDPRANPSPTSLQFSVRGLSAQEIPVFLDLARARGVPVKWFGAARQSGFTSAPRHWAYAGSQGPLAATHHVLAGLCDIRTPVTLTDAECDLIATIVCESLETAARAASVTAARATTQAENHQRDNPLQAAS